MQPTPGRDVRRSSGNEGSHRSCSPPARRRRSTNASSALPPKRQRAEARVLCSPRPDPPAGCWKAGKLLSGDGAKRRSLPLRLGCGAAARWDAQLCVVPGPAAPHSDFERKQEVPGKHCSAVCLFRALPAAAEEEVAVRGLLLPGRGTQQHAAVGHRPSDPPCKALFCTSISKPGSHP